jgi:hypothetical protein
VADVCGTCHAQNLQFFQASRHAEAFADLGAPGCVQCHSNHAILRGTEAMLAGPDSVCITCHSEGDVGAQRAQAMVARINKLDDAIRVAQGTLHEADLAGMDVSTATADLTAAHSQLVMSRTAIHSLDVSKVNAEVDKGIPIAERAAQEGRDKLAEVQSRRVGVALFSLLVLAIVLTLYLYIRSENKAHQPTS